MLKDWPVTHLIKGHDVPFMLWFLAIQGELTFPINAPALSKWFGTKSLECCPLHKSLRSSESSLNLPCFQHQISPIMISLQLCRFSWDKLQTWLLTNLWDQKHIYISSPTESLSDLPKVQATSHPSTAASLLDEESQKSLMDDIVPKRSLNQLAFPPRLFPISLMLCATSWDSKNSQQLLQALQPV